MQKQSVEHGYLTAIKETIKVVREKKVFKEEIVHIKEVVRALSQTFLELVVQPEDTAEATV